MTQADRIIEKFGGLTALAKALGHKNPTTVQGWRNAGHIPVQRHQEVYDVARRAGIEIYPHDFLVITDGESAA